MILPQLHHVKRRPVRGAHKAERILAVVGAARDVPSGVRYDLELLDDVERVQFNADDRSRRSC